MAVGSRRRIAIIGAGPAGLAAAVKLAEAGCDVDLYESQAQVGGLSRTLELWGHKVDLGPHRFFSQSEKVNRFWFSMVATRFAWVRRQTRIFYKKRYFNYPLQALNTFFNLGAAESARCLLSYLGGFAKRAFKGSSADGKNFEDWVVGRFGRRLYGIFFKTYSEKLWGLPCARIDADFAVRKIRRLSFFQVLKNFLSYKKTHVEFFAYPHQGTGSVYERMAEVFSENGGHLFLNAPVDSVELADGRPRIASRGKNRIYDQLISTMPLPYLVRSLGAPENVLQAARDLKFRHTVLVYLLIERRDHFADNWIYVHSPEVDFGRVTNFSNWSPQLNGHLDSTVLCLEYWCSEEDALWRSADGALIENATLGLRDSGLVKNLKVRAAAVYRVPKSYPIFQLDYGKNLDVLNEYLKSFENIYSIGRNGSFSYNNQDHSILMGLEAAENILRGLRHEAVVLPDRYEEDGEIPRFAATEEI